ncbi:MAG: heme ABC transporter ATP-binding protein [candidate division WOR-3 bacterium]|nr:MAG: heme ABC transporter ATP-binding protein [candidate division WOR-3 bacterium]
MNALQVINARFHYDTSVVIDNVSLSLTKGEFLGIIGPNGAGKSTMLRLMCGILKPRSGDITLFDKTLSEQSQKTIARQIAFVPQETHFTLNFTVEDVVMLGRYPYQRPFAREEKKDFEAIDYAIAAAQVEHLRKRPINSLSSGERQRVVIARALAQVPRILLLDEPTSHLDLHHQYSIMESLKKLNAEGLTVAVVHHDLNLASLYCARLVLMHGGRIVASGTPNKLINEETLNQVYGAKVRIVQHPDRGVPQIFLHTE